MSDRLLKESDVMRAVDERIKELSNDSAFIRKNGYIDVLGVKKHISAIPSAEGEWIEDPINKNIMYCSNCKASYTKDFLRGMSLYHEPKDTPNFCPNCGVDMREPS